MKPKSPTPWLTFSSRLLLCPLPDISLAKWDLAPLSQHHCIKDKLSMKIFPYLSYTIIFSIFFVLFCVQNLCCNDSKYHSLN